VTDDHHVIDVLREAADPRLAPGAASRIADGAWARAAAAPRLGVSRFLAGPRALWAAAAAVLVAVSVLALHGTDPAFAVEGDPVMVARGGEMVPTNVVHLGSVVSVPEQGSRVLRWRDGGVFSPRPGSLFRLVRSDGGPHAGRIEFERGGGEFDGASFVVASGDMAVESAPSRAPARFSITLTAGSGEASVAIESGTACVRSLATSDYLVLNATERAATKRVRLGGIPAMRLAKVADWTCAADRQIATGRVSVVDVDFRPVGGITLFGTTQKRELLAFEVPPAEVQDAIGRVNAHAVVRFAFRHAAPAAEVDARYVYENNGRRVEVTTRRDGTVGVSEGGVSREFGDLASFRRDAPELAALFGDTLGADPAAR
jgi:hypothetical protein